MKEVKMKFLSDKWARLAITLPMAWPVASFAIVSPNDPAPASYLTSKLRHGCGHADAIWDYVRVTMNEKPKMHYPLSPCGDETGRRLLVYSDSSWVVTYEFFSTAGTEQDRSCIVGTGNVSTLSEAVDFCADELPADEHPSTK